VPENWERRFQHAAFPEQCKLLEAGGLNATALLEEEEN